MKKKLALYCFENLNTFLETGKPLDFPQEFDSLKNPLFVTWQKYYEKYKQHDLRGCIGTFAEGQPLGKTLQRYSLIAAVQDTRFSPIETKELPSLKVEISLLSNFEPINDPTDWEVGKHGIEIEFKDGGGREYRGTFLPNVAPE